MTSKQSVHDFWNRSSCGEDLYLDSFNSRSYLNQSRSRYELEGSLIFPFARFNESSSRSVLEIGVGLGADHQMFAQFGAKLTGIDLTQRAVDHTSRRFSLFNLNSNLAVGDSESLEFSDASFDIVYSWGVLHHSPNTSQAINEVYRVLRFGGIARIMMYNKYSAVGFMLWIRYGLLKGRPFATLNSIYSRYLESPGTKAYTYSEVKKLFSDFTYVQLSSPLTHGDLLNSQVGQSHRGLLLSIARAIWPRFLIRFFFPQNGLYLLITAYK